VERLLDRERDLNGGKYPESIALVLWGTDNIKTYGESLAQVRAVPLTSRQPLGRGPSTGVAAMEHVAGNLHFMRPPWQYHEATLAAS